MIFSTCSIRVNAVGKQRSPCAWGSMCASASACNFFYSCSCQPSLPNMVFHGKVTVAFYSVPRAKGSFIFTTNPGRTLGKLQACYLYFGTLLSFYVLDVIPKNSMRSLYYSSVKMWCLVPTLRREVHGTGIANKRSRRGHPDTADATHPDRLSRAA